RQGHCVKIFATLGRYDYSKFEDEHGVAVENIKMAFADVNSDGPIKRSLMYRIIKRGFNRLLEFPDIEFFFRISGHLKNERDVDLLITIGAPHSIHWGTAFFKTMHKEYFPKMWVADCGDPYM